NFFSCMPIYTYISQLLQQPGGLHEKAQKIYAGTTRLDLRISNISHKGYKVTPELLLSYQESLEELYEQTQIAYADSSLNEINKELVFLMKAKTFSLYEQTLLIARDA